MTSYAEFAGLQLARMVLILLAQSPDCTEVTSSNNRTDNNNDIILIGEGKVPYVASVTRNNGALDLLPLSISAHFYRYFTVILSYTKNKKERSKQGI